MAKDSETRIPCSIRTRDDILRPLKRGGETYDELLQRLATEYRRDRGRTRGDGINNSHIIDDGAIGR